MRHKLAIASITPFFIFCFILVGSKEAYSFGKTIDQVIAIKEPKLICKEFRLLSVLEKKSKVSIYVLPKKDLDLTKLNELQLMVVRNVPIFRTEYKATFQTNYIKFSSKEGDFEYSFLLDRTSLQLKRKVEYKGYGAIAEAMRNTFNETNYFSCKLATDNDVKNYLKTKRNSVKEILDKKFEDLDRLRKKRKL